MGVIKASQTSARPPPPNRRKRKPEPLVDAKIARIIEALKRNELKLRGAERAGLDLEAEEEACRSSS